MKVKEMSIIECSYTPDDSTVSLKQAKKFEFCIKDEGLSVYSVHESKNGWKICIVSIPKKHMIDNSIGISSFPCFSCMHKVQNFYLFLEWLSN